MYFYCFCRGRQRGLCDHPYVPVEAMEKAVADHYASGLFLPQEFRDQVRDLVVEAVAENTGLSDDLRQRYQRRLVALDNKESYLLDLAAEEGWPKDILRDKITGIRLERKDIQASLDTAQKQLDTGRQVFEHALELLDDPKRLYQTADEATRTMLNKAFFTRLTIDGRKVFGHRLQEPFDVLEQAHRRQDDIRDAQTTQEQAAGRQRESLTYYRVTGGMITTEAGETGLAEGRTIATGAYPEGGAAAGQADTRQDPSLLTEAGVLENISLTGLLDLALTLRGQGSSKAVMVGRTRHHANQSILIVGNPFPICFSRSRGRTLGSA